MIREGASDNVHTISVGNGRSSQGNLPNAEGVGGQSTAAKSARKVLGSFTGTGVLLRLNNTPIPLRHHHTLGVNIWLEVRQDIEERGTKEERLS
jgi:hypothetical protein